MERVKELDGLRGVGCLAVVASHLICGFFPAIYFDAGPIQNSPLKFFYDGNFAVAMFFVLSGFVLAGSYAKSEGGKVALVIGRYLRLTIPVGGSILLAWSLLAAGLDRFPEMIAALGGKWIAGLNPFPLISFSTALEQAASSVYTQGGSSVNSALWTMKIELAGSIFLIGFYKLIPVYRPQMLAASAFAFVMLANEETVQGLGFVLGAMLCELNNRGWLRRLSLVSIPALLLGCHVGVHMGAGEMWPYWLFQWLSQQVSAVFQYCHQHGIALGAVRLFAAALFILGIVSNKWVSGLMRMSAPQWLGRNSFSIYVTHLPLYLSVLPVLYFMFEAQASLLRLSATIFIYVSIVLLAAPWYTRFVDEPAVSLQRVIAQLGRGRSWA